MIKSIEFVKHLDIKQEGSNLTLVPKKELLNHIGSIHAGAIYTLAESQSGLCLMQQFKNKEAKALLRSSKVKYKAEAKTKLTAKCHIDQALKDKFITQLNKRGKALIDVEVKVFDNNNQLILEATFSWFIVTN